MFFKSKSADKNTKYLRFNVYKENIFLWNLRNMCENKHEEPMYWKFVITK